MTTIAQTSPAMFEAASPLAPLALAADTAGGPHRSGRVRPAPRLLDRLEAAVALAGTLLVFHLHVFFAQNVGALWRDEVNSVQLATFPSFGQVWQNLQFDSFPIVFFGVLRGWTALFTTDDMALRVLGLLIGLGIVGALWLNARLLGARWPLFSLVLLGCNPMFVRYGDSMRAYGLGMLLILLTTAAVWRVLESPRPWRWVLAAAAALLSVQTLYYNSVLLFAICVAGAIAACRERRWKTAVCILAIGAPAAASLAVYAGTIHRLHEWNFLVQYPVTLAWLWHKLSDVTGSPLPVGVWVWSILFVSALALAGWWLARRRKDTLAATAAPADRAILFAASSLGVLTICYPIFLEALNYLTQPWYYVAYLALVAVCLDVVFGRVLAETGSKAGRVARMAFFVTLTGLTFWGARSELFARQTNVDLVAARLNNAAVEGDLIVSSRWECAITFGRYYHGRAPLVTLPPMDDHRLHRYDLVKAQMMAVNPLAPVLEKMATTLQAGHRVWIVGPLVFTPPGEKPTNLPPARMEGGHWTGGPFYDSWVTQASYLIQQHATRSVELAVMPRIQPVVPVYEQVSLTGFEGWR